MAHNNYHQMMSLALDGLLNPGDRDVLDVHLGECAACTAAWEAMRGLGSLFQRAPVLNPPPDFTVQVMGRVEAHRAGRRRVENIFWFALLGLLSLVMLSRWLPAIGPTAVTVVPLLPAPVARLVESARPALEVFNTVTAVVATLADALALWLAYVVNQPVTWTALLATMALIATWVGLVGVFGPSGTTSVASQRANLS